MAVTQLETSLRTVGNTVVIDLIGEINGFAEPALGAAYHAAESQDPRAILLNFSGTDYINSTGIALIVSLLTGTQKSNRRLAAYGLSNHYLEIFQITRLADFIDIYTDEASALAGIVK